MSRLLDMGSQKSGAVFHMLDVQYRMHPMICLWPNNQYYQGRLKTASSILKRPKQETFNFGPLTFIDVDGSEKREARSYYNEVEVEAILALLSDLGVFQERINATVSILTFYSAQTRLLRRRLRERTKNDSVEIQRRASMLHIDTVDSMQGSEADIVLLSFVRCTNNIGFLANPRRLNVALTRAKRQLVLVGKWAALAACDSADIRDLMKSVNERKLVLRPATGTQADQRNNQRNNNQRNNQRRNNQRRNNQRRNNQRKRQKN